MRTFAFDTRALKLDIMAQDILVVRTTQLEINHCILSAVLLAPSDTLT